MDQAPAPRKFVYLALTASAFLWGSGFAIAKFALREVTPLQLLAGAGIFSATTQLIWTVGRGRLRLLKLPWPIAPLILGMAIAGQNVFSGLTYWGLASTTATNAAILYGFSPTLIAVLAALLLRERLTIWKVGGAVVGFIGVALIITQGHLSSLQLHGMFIGNLIVFGATVYWSAYSVATRWLTQKIPVETYSFYILTVGAVVPVTWVWLERGQFPLAGLRTPTLSAIAFMGIGTGALAINCWNWGLAQIEAARAGMFSYLEPVFAGLVAMIFLSERLSLPSLLGAAIVFSGIYLSTRQTNTNELREFE
jgi:drug/metabolite transporter (DMT)-like permease